MKKIILAALIMAMLLASACGHHGDRHGAARVKGQWDINAGSGRGI